MGSTQLDTVSRSRRWFAPPPLTHAKGERIAGMVVLEEFPDETGMLLWSSLRSVMLWASRPLGERERLFLPDAVRKRKAEIQQADVDPLLRVPLETLAQMLDAGVAPSPGAVANACRELSEWADEQRKLGTALAFMQAAAITVPADAHLAYLTGRFARRRAEYARAESWFSEAIVRNRYSHDWRVLALTYIGVGNLYLQRGNFPEARRLYTRALRTARKRGLREIEGMACHDLFVIAHESGRFEEADLFAIDGIRAYGPGHPRLPNLAHDIAVFWMNRGEFGRALPVLQALLPHIHSPRERLLTFGSIARAAGAVADRKVFDEMWTEIWRTTEDGPRTEGASQALLALAQGAASAGEWERAERAATRSLEISVKRREAQIQLVAAALHESVHHARLAEESIQTPVQQPNETADALARELVASLQAGGTGRV